ncbi:MAG: DUF4416 family protein, partial [Phycisphaerales bacterium]
MSIQMWETKDPKPVKLIIGILAANEDTLGKAVEAIVSQFGAIDFKSDTWPFTQTEYYQDEMGRNVLRQFVT